MNEKTDKKGFLQALTWPQATLVVFLGAFEKAISEQKTKSRQECRH